MARPSELRHRIPYTHNFEYDEYKEFEAIVGKDHVSRELRAMIRNFLEEEKKGEARLDPLNQVRQNNTKVSKNNNATLDIYLSNYRDLEEFVYKFESTDDIQTLAKIETNSKNLRDLAHDRKVDLCTLNRMKKLR